VISTTKAVVNKTFGATEAGTFNLLGGKGAWAAFKPIGADLAASSITTLSFHRANEQSGTQDLDTYTQNQMYYFPGIIKEIVLSAGNIRLYRHASLNVDGDRLVID
jgi:hypothetical protein